MATGIANNPTQGFKFGGTGCAAAVVIHARIFTLKNAEPALIATGSTDHGAEIRLNGGCSRRRNGKLPVLVYIRGGSNTGDSSGYEFNENNLRGRQAHSTAIQGYLSDFLRHPNGGIKRQKAACPSGWPEPENMRVLSFSTAITRPLTSR